MLRLILLLSDSFGLKLHPITSYHFINFVHFLVDLLSNLLVIESYEGRLVSWSENPMTFELETFA